MAIMRIRPALEAIANVTVIIVAVGVGFIVLSEKFAAPGIPRSVGVGDRLDRVRGIDWSTHRRTLVLALNSACHYCRESAPFYRRLAQAAAGNDPQLVAVFPNDSQDVRQFSRDEGLTIRSIPAVALEELGVVATPTLLLVDRGGRVEQSWVGVLSPRQEVELLKVTAPERAAGQEP